MAEDLTTTIGFNTQGAEKNLASLVVSLNLYNQGLAKTATTTKTFNATQAEVGGRSATRANQAFNRLVQSQQKVQTQAKATERALIDGFRRPQTEVAKLDKAASRLGNTFATAFSLAALFALQRVLVSSTQAAIEFQFSLAEVRTLAVGAGSSFDELSASVREVSDLLGAPLEQVTEGVYQILSNQVAEAANAFEVLIPAQQLATVTASETGDAINAISSILNSFALQAEDSGQVAAALFKTVDLGRLRLGEFGNTIGRVTELSRTLGISFEEVLGSLAALTQTGVPAAEAITQLSGVARAFIKPSDDLTAALDRIGFASGQAAIAELGFIDTLVALSDEVNNNAQELGKLFPRIRGLRGVISAAVTRTDDFKNAIAEVSAAAEGLDIAEPFAEFQATDAKQVTDALNEIRNIFVVDLGQTSVAAIASLFDVVGGGANAVRATTAAVALLAGGFLIMRANAAAATAAAVTGFATIRTEALLTRAAVGGLFGAFAIGATLGNLFVVPFINSFREIEEGAEELTNRITEEFEKQAKAEEEFLRDINARRRTAEETATRDILTELERRRSEFESSARELLAIESSILDQTVGQVRDRIRSFDDVIDKIRDTASKAADEIKKLNDQIITIQGQQDLFNLERSLRGLDDSQKAFRLIEESQSRIRASNRALAQGDEERADELAKIAQRLAEQGLAAADQSGNLATQNRLVGQVNRAFDQQQKIRQTLIDQTKQEATDAQQVLPGLEDRALIIEGLLAQVKELAKQAADTKLTLIERGEASDQIEVIADIINRGISQGIEETSFLGKFNDELRKLQTQAISEINIPFRSESLDRIRDDLQELGAIGGQLGRELEAAFGVDANLLQGEELTNAVKAQNTALAERADLEVQINGLRKKQEANNVVILGQLEKIKKEAEAAAAPTVLRGGEFGGVGVVIPATAEDIETLEQINELVEAFNQQVSEGADFETLTNIREQFTLLQQETADRPIGRLVAEGVREAILAIDDLRTSVSELPKLEIELQSLSDASIAILTVRDSIKLQGDAVRLLAEEAPANAATFNQGELIKIELIDQTTAALATQEEQAKLTAEANAAAAASGVTDRAFGGMMFRQRGGLAYLQTGGFARGTDNILTSLSPGESINTVRATRSFAPQIQAMNANVRPVFREQGGTVTTNIGDININVTANPNNTQELIRGISQGIDRQIRRGTSANVRRRR